MLHFREISSRPSVAFSAKYTRLTVFTILFHSGERSAFERTPVGLALGECEGQMLQAELEQRS